MRETWIYLNADEQESAEKEIENNRKGVVGNWSTEVSEEAGKDKFQTVDIGLSIRKEEGPYFDQLKKRYMQMALCL